MPSQAFKYVPTSPAKYSSPGHTTQQIYIISQGQVHDEAVYKLARVKQFPQMVRTQYMSSNPRCRLELLGAAVENIPGLSLEPVATDLRPILFTHPCRAAAWAV